MPKPTQDLIKEDFKSKKKAEKHYLIGALVALIGTILPWFSMGEKSFISVSVNGWNSWGYLSVVASAAILALYILPFFKIQIPKIFKNKAQEQKVLSGVMLAGPVMWLIETNFKLSYLGLGFYVTAFASGYVFYLIYKKT